MKNKTLILTAMTAALGVSTSYGAVVITTVGDGTGYDTTEAQTAAWRSTSVDKGTLDDGDNAFGTDGSWFVGDGSTTSPVTSDTDNSPAWATTFTKNASATNAASSVYDKFDNPNLAIAPTVADWANTAFTGTNAAGWQSNLTFAITAATPDQFRLGILAGNEGQRWNPTGLRLSFDDGTGFGTAVEYTGLADELGMVFFDITITGSTTGTFNIEGIRGHGVARAGGMAGVTFDVVPEPSTYALLAGCLALSAVMVRRRRA